MALPSAGNGGFSEPMNFSYAQAVSQLTDKVSKHAENSSFKLPMCFPVDIDGELGFVFLDSEMVKAAEDLKFALVMKFMRVRPSIDKLHLHVVKNWGLIEIPQISFMDDYHILIHMKNERDFIHGWTREGRYVEGNPFRLFKWTRDFDLEKESPLAPQWIFLPGLPMHVYRRDCLQILATRFGRFLGTDNATLNKTRATGARLCVEMNLKEENIKGFPIIVSANKTIWQEVRYEKPEHVAERLKKGKLVRSDTGRQNEVLGSDQFSSLVGDGIAEKSRKDMHTSQVSEYGAMAQNNSAAEVELVDAASVEPVISEESDPLQGKEGERREEKFNACSTMVSLLVQKDDPHQDPEGEDEPSALARQKQYNSEPESKPTSRLGSSRNRLKSLVKKFGVSIVGILEPFAADDKMSRLAFVLGLPNHFSNAVVDGKIWIFWSDDCDWEVLSMTNQSISGIFRCGEENLFISFIYAKCNSIERRDLWQSLELVDSKEDPWLVVGDFNVIREDSERVGGHPRPIRAMEEFNNCIDHCGLLDMQVTGRRLSWCNGHEGHTRSWARLDRALINIHYANRFPSACFEYLIQKTSDHCPMLIAQKQEVGYGPHPFRFQNMWVTHTDFRRWVEEVWKEPTTFVGLRRLAEKLKKTKLALRAWNRKVFGHVGQNIKELEERLEVLDSHLQGGYDEEAECDYLVTKLELDIWEKREELQLSQLAKQKWLSEGALKYFQDFLSNPSLAEQVDLTHLIQKSVSEENNLALVLAPTETEVLTALKSIPKESSPGPDGFGSGFYLSCWDLIKEDVLDAAKDFFSVFVNGGKRSVQRLLNILEVYEKWSGQLINKEKLAVYFSKSITLARRRILMRTTGFVEGKFPFTYLGVPMVSGRLTSRHLEPLVEKVRRRIAGWKSKLLSQGGRLTLMKHVLACMSTHLLAVLNVPMKVFSRLNSLMATFFWGDTNGKQKMKWCAWDRICKPYKEGGLGIRNFHEVQRALHMKFAWRLVTVDNLWTKFFRAKYVREGSSSFWFDRWLASGPLGASRESGPSQLKIKDVWIDGSWDENVLVDLVGINKTEEIMNGVVAGKVGTDITIWKPEVEGVFTSASAWDLIRVKGPEHLGMGWIWHHYLPRKISVCMWKARFNGLALDSRVQRLGIPLASRCNYCAQGHIETLNHVLCNGSIAAEVWKKAAIMLGMNYVQGLPWWLTVMQWFNAATKSSHRGVLLGLIPSIISWRLWRCRCKARMENSAESAKSVWLAVRVWIRKISSLMVKQVAISARDEVILRDLEVPYVGRSQNIPKLVYWRKPAEGWIKLNVDGSCRGNPGNCGGGGVIRDTLGNFKGAFSSYFGQGTNNEAELKALIAGVSLRKCTAWYLWDYRDELLSQLRVVHFTITHQFREGNTAADFLARRGEEGNSITFLEFMSLPRELKGMLRMDKAGLPQLRRFPVGFPVLFHGFPQPKVRLGNKIGRKAQ
ncbi:hypothetical protein Patl1_32423 [Pistacia atlantica]|uniref:Uncharacterized protein n=1 Tax=Pistacia atlantica TaxID=434234 RepID=A0ACC1APU2_9ROSI|nr:hypothetical protein Patl1_32423 [Pistacia atlantica]